MAERLTLDQIEVDPDKHSIFVITYPGRLRQEQQERLIESWKAAWDRTGLPCDRVPPALILDGGCDIKSLTNEGLKRLGLVRVSKPDEFVI